MAGELPLDGTSASPSVKRDFKIDLNTRELVLSGGDLVFTTDADSILQDIDMRLRFWKGEWFLDSDVGVPYLESILVKSPHLPLIRTVFRTQLLAVPGVLDVIDLRFQFEGAIRRLRVFFTVSTDFGELRSQVVVGG